MKTPFSLLLLTPLLLAAQDLSLDDIMNLRDELNKDRETIERLQHELEELQAVRAATVSELENQYQTKAEIAKELQNQVKPQESCCPCPATDITCYRAPIKQSAAIVSVDFLWWTAEEGALSYAVKGQPTPPSGQNIGQSGDLEKSKFDWDPGVRASLAYRFCPSFWETELEYAYININGSNAFNAPSDLTRNLTSTYLKGGQFVISRAPSHLDLTHQTAHLALARRFLFEDHLILRLSMAFTGTWIDQEWEFQYQGTGGIKVKHDHDWSFKGGGMRLGFDTDWYIGKGFSLFGKVSGASYIGFYKNEIKAHTNNANTIFLEPYDIQDTTYSDQRLVNNLQFLMGPRYGQQVSWWGFEIFAGYELNTWFNLQEQSQSAIEVNSPLITRPTILSRGILGYQGFTGQLKFTF